MPVSEAKLNELYLDILNGPDGPSKEFLKKFLEKKESNPDFKGLKILKKGKTK